MRIIAWGIVVAALACGAGCARPDWIEQTLVTVDVTGTWHGSVTGTGAASYEFVLEQQGPKVKGSVRRYGGMPGRSDQGNLSGAIEGTVSGDSFSFRETSGLLTGYTTVSGDEMTGQVSFYVVRTINLRRVNLPSRPSPQGQ